MRISDWSSDGGSSDLVRCYAASRAVRSVEGPHVPDAPGVATRAIRPALVLRSHTVQQCAREHARPRGCFVARQYRRTCVEHGPRSEEHTSELQSLMRISYAVLLLKKKTITLIYVTETASVILYT